LSQALADDPSEVLREVAVIFEDCTESVLQSGALLNRPGPSFPRPKTDCMVRAKGLAVIVFDILSRRGDPMLQIRIANCLPRKSRRQAGGLA
jgi:hypothetical protein